MTKCACAAGSLPADDAVAHRRGRARDEDAPARGEPLAQSPRCASHVVPLRQSVRPRSRAHGLVGRGHRVEVMAQVAGRGQERRLAVLVAAITGNGLQRGQRGPDLGTVVIGEGQRKEPERIVDVFAFAETGADDDARHAGLIQDEAARDVGDRDTVARRHRRGRLQHALQRAPSAGDSQEAAVLHQGPCREALPVGLRRSEPAFGEPAAGQRAVREQVHAVLDAEGAPIRPPRADRAARTTPGSTRRRCRSRRRRGGGRCRRWSGPGDG